MAFEFTLQSYPCAVCGSTAFDKRYMIKGFHIVQCRDCSFVYVNPRIKTEELYRIYSSDYFNNTQFGYENYDLNARLRKLTFEKWYSLILPYLGSRKGKALDIGCASGDFIEVLLQNGWTDVDGIELDPVMIEKLKQKNIPVSTIPLEKQEIHKRYDLITLFDVVEHLPGLSDAFGKLHDLLEDGGVIALITPDYSSTQRKLFGSKWFQFKPYEHIQYFTPKTLARALKPHGLKIIYHAASGQCADAEFLGSRLERYNFKRLATLFNGFVKLTGLKNKAWYADTGSMFAVIQQEKKI
ncbi:MAG TPA: class I SAM-dependent methyltransferase [Bacteroidia bacterium]|jgi:2-polyprenyl-3-methyl-5-hydroxy-6-metoxy-1,4-benzoquinol methylase|nr:class I SAM-dependent methyltransferase [Bacteroidia bacterium]